MPRCRLAGVALLFTMGALAVPEALAGTATATGTAPAGSLASNGVSVTPPTPIDIGVLPGGTDSRALGLNDGGEVVGWSYAGVGGKSAVHAFSWTRSGGLVDLHSDVTLGGYDSAASEVSDNGQVAGWSFTSGEVPHAFSWTQSGGVVDLGTLPGGSESRATRVNDEGQVVGWADVTPTPSGQDSGTRHAFSWTPGTGMIDLGTFGGSASTSSAVSNSGEVVGYADTTSGAWHAFSWTPGGGMVDLGTLGGSTSAAHAVSPNTGEIAGQSAISNGDVHAFAWTQTGGMVDLGTMGGPTSIARGVNDNGVVVGYGSTGSGALRGFAWTQATGMIELSPLAGDTGSDAEAINSDGLVVGWSQDAAGHTHATAWQLPALPRSTPGPASSPRLSALRVKPHSFRAARRGPSAASRSRMGTTVRYRLTQAAVVTFRVQRALLGRRKGKKCLPDTSRRGSLPLCTRYQLLKGSFPESGKAGRNAFRFTGRLNNKTLRPGKYEMIAFLRSSSGAMSTPVGSSFTIKR